MLDGFVILFSVYPSWERTIQTRLADLEEPLGPSTHSNLKWQEKPGCACKPGGLGRGFVDQPGDADLP